MSSLWIGHDVRLEAPCALKFVDLDVGDSTELIQRFSREAKAAAQLRSPHVVQVFDYGACGIHRYIAMELLEGQDLSARLAERGTLTPVETVKVVEQVARALTRAHAMGVVHRDIKPENIFIVGDARSWFVKVLDFGIAKSTQLGSADARTQVGAILGSPSYMSPEQADGTKPVDHRADLWSLAVVAYQCLTGQLPFDSEALGDLLMRIMSHPVPVPSRIRPELAGGFDAWWARAASRDPAARFQSADELQEALARALDVPTESERGSNPDLAPYHPTRSDPVSAPVLPVDLAATVPFERVATPWSDALPRGATFAGHSRTTLRSAPPQGRQRTSLAWLCIGGIALGIGLGAIASMLSEPVDTSADTASAHAHDAAEHAVRRVGDGAAPAASPAASDSDAPDRPDL